MRLTKFKNNSSAGNLNATVESFDPSISKQRFEFDGSYAIAQGQGLPTSPLDQVVEDKILIGSPRSDAIPAGFDVGELTKHLRHLMLPRGQGTAPPPPKAPQPEAYLERWRNI
jgi:hypothetical protein